MAFGTRAFAQVSSLQQWRLASRFLLSDRLALTERIEHGDEAEALLRDKVRTVESVVARKSRTCYVPHEDSGAPGVVMLNDASTERNGYCSRVPHGGFCWPARSLKSMLNS